MTSTQMRKAIKDAATVEIHSDDIDEFAYRVDQLSAPLGTVTWLRVECNRDAKPDIADWIEPAFHDWMVVKDMTEDAAKSWWINMNMETWVNYGHGITEMKETYGQN